MKYITIWYIFEFSIQLMFL